MLVFAGQRGRESAGGIVFCRACPRLIVERSPQVSARVVNPTGRAWVFIIRTPNVVNSPRFVDPSGGSPQALPIEKHSATTEQKRFTMIAMEEINSLDQSGFAGLFGRVLERAVGKDRGEKDHHARRDGVGHDLRDAGLSIDPVAVLLPALPFRRFRGGLFRRHPLP